MTLSSNKAPYLTIPVLTLFLFINSCSDGIVYPEGGYSYLEKVTAEDTNFYFLPIRHTLSRKDSFMIVPGFRNLFEGFNEQNLSIKPPKEDVFRFIYYAPFSAKCAIIKLTRNKIEIKVPRSGSFELAPDETKLNSLEKIHFDLLYTNYPLTDEPFSDLQKRYADSLLKIYPQLLDPAYYQLLIDKLFSKSQGPFEYSIKQLNITFSKYKYFVDLINDSEFWTRPYHSKEHEESFADGDAFFLEAVTKHKYQCIMSNMYLDGPSKFRRVFDELVKFTSTDSLISWETYEEFVNRPVKNVEIRELELTNLKEEKASQSKKKKAQ